MVIRLDPRYESINELSLDLVSWRAIPECTREREQLLVVGPVTCKSQRGCVAVRGRREWMTIRRREASLVTSAMSGSAIMGTCTVT